jgi:hypothetical protein
MSIHTINEVSMKRYLLFLAVASVIVVGGVRADGVSDWNSIANSVETCKMVLVHYKLI